MTYENSDESAAKLDAVAKDVAEMKSATERRELGVELGLSDAKAVDAVHALVKSGLTAQEARQIASQREPALFNAPDPRGFIAGQHGSLRPAGPSAPPAPPTVKERSDAIAKHRYQNPMEADVMEKRLHGELLRKALVEGGAAGWK